MYSLMMPLDSAEGILCNEEKGEKMYILLDLNVYDIFPRTSSSCYQISSF